VKYSGRFPAPEKRTICECACHYYIDNFNLADFIEKHIFLKHIESNTYIGKVKEYS